MYKELKTIDLYEKRKSIKAELDAMVETAKKEERKLNADEDASFTSKKAELDALTEEINKRKNNTYTNTNKMENRASISRIMAWQMGLGGLTAADEKLLQRGEDKHITSKVADTFYLPVEKRGTLSMGTYGTQGIQDEEHTSPLMPLDNNLVLAQAGATILTGLKGDLVVPNFTAASVTWEGENGISKDAGVTIGSQKYSPKKLTAFVPISKLMLIQQGENMDVEAMVVKMLERGLRQKLEATALGKAAATDDMPAGLFSGNINRKGNLTWENVVKMETDLADAATGNCAYIGNSNLTAALKSKVKDASGAGAFVYNPDQSGLVNGYKYFSTNNVAKELNVVVSGTADNTGYGLILADWERFIIAQFGSIAITLDTMSSAKYGIINVIADMYVDFKFAQSGCYSIAALK